MRHIPDGLIRRLDDEPLAVPDRVADHVAGCGRCRARRDEIAEDTMHVARLFSTPRLAPDLDTAWARLQRELETRQPHRGVGRGHPRRVRPHGARVPRVSLRSALAVVSLGIMVVGSAAAATLTSVFSPTHVAPISVSQTDLRAIAALTGLGDGETFGGFSTPNGSSAVRFGTFAWSSDAAHSATSLSQAAAEAGFLVTVPAHLPAGVGAVQRVMVQPRVKATVTFNSTARGLAGSTVTLDAGPAVVAEYGGTGGTGVPTLGIATMRRPTARSMGASITRIEAFLLSQPSVPAQLAEEIRLLGDVRTTLPVPVPPGASVRSVQVAGQPGLLLADSSNAASAVIWEDGRGLLHAVVGIVDSQDVMKVADQIG